MARGAAPLRACGVVTDIEGRFSDLQPEPIPAAERPVYVLRIRAEPHTDETHAIRHALKAMLRHYGFRCLSIVPEKPQG
jgi:hypothetical protein